MKSPGGMAGTVIGSDVVLVAPVRSKLSRCSPAFGPLLDTAVKLGAVFWYDKSLLLPAAEK